MKIAAILVISLLAIIGGAAPAPALNDDDLQLYKRQAPPPPPPPAPPLPLNLDDSKTYDWRAKLKEKKNNKPAGEGGPAKAPQPSGPFQLGQIPEGGFHLKSVNRDKKLWDAEPGSEDGVIKNNDDPDFKPKPKAKPKSSSNTPGKVKIPDFDQQSTVVDTDVQDTPPSSPSSPPPPPPPPPPAPPLPPNNGGRIPQVKLKPTTRKHKPEPPAPEPPLHKFRLRKTSYRDDPKGRNSENSDTDEEQTGRDSPASRQRKSSPGRTSPKVAPRRLRLKKEETKE
ncbi:hypothetical protein BASA50_008236 [Batrachochytrium salamandrivorans]|uniref:Uncharacterized protein n=1 Tax=Batrachochytrium salamandrivorans TaxID=1357716 RepID=A0ABQ8F7Q3_9FUNG|nr:hypothetical protein BASA50_008236 [Batrachochytrium salamandrivorans]